MFTNIRKRDGRIVEFDSLKIASAIAKAAKVTGAECVNGNETPMVIN